MRRRERLLFMFLSLGARESVGDERLDLIDDEHLYGSGAALQLQLELFLERGKEQWAIIGGSCSVFGSVFWVVARSSNVRLTYLSVISAYISASSVSPFFVTALRSRPS